MKKSRSENPSETRDDKALRLTDLETEIMQVVWSKGNVSASEVREALMPHRPLAHTTILTVLEKLRRKRAVRVVPSLSRAKRFRACVEKDEVACRLIDKLCSRFFNGSTASLVAHLVKEQEIDQKELEEIRKLLDQGQD